MFRYQANHGGRGKAMLGVSCDDGKSDAIVQIRKESINPRPYPLNRWPNEVVAFALETTARTPR